MLLRIADLQPYVRLSRATILALEAQGRFPRAARMNCRVTQYQSSDVIEFLADPAGYRAPGLDSSASATCGEAE